MILSVFITFAIQRPRCKATGSPVPDAGLKITVHHDDGELHHIVAVIPGPLLHQQRTSGDNHLVGEID